MKISKRKVLSMSILLIVIVVTYAFFHPLGYYAKYFKKVGIGEEHTYNDVVQKLGRPKNIEKNDTGWCVHYDDFELHYGENIEKGVLKCVIIKNGKYRFGVWNIGIGSSKSKVESVYRHVKKLKNLPYNEFVVIDGGTYVWFTFDNEERVSEIRLTTGF